MSVDLVGIGEGSEASLTGAAEKAIKEADILIGAQRMLSTLPKNEAKTFFEYKSEKIAEIIKENLDKKIAVLYSGDVGFYSGAKTLYAILCESGIKARLIPGISSVQAMAAKAGLPWQDWRLVSAHGLSCDPVHEVMQGSPVFFLTGGNYMPKDIGRELTEAGLGDLKVYIGENLSYPDEKVSCMSAREASEYESAPLSVFLSMPAPVYTRRVSGIPDEEFIRTKVPMTKQEVRAAVLAKLGIQENDVCWDIGAGTGSVSIEMALHAKSVWAIEQKAEAIELIHENRKRFCAWNLRVFEGKAPDGMEKFPRPDAVFIGGSSGNMPEIIDFILEKNPKARICISAIAVESLGTALSCFKEKGLTYSVTQLSVSRTKEIGDLHLLMAQNPIFLISTEE